MGSAGGEGGDVSPLSMSDMYYLLLSDLSEVSDQIDNTRKHAKENNPQQSWGSYLRDIKMGHDNPNEIQSLFKKNILDAVGKHLQNMNPKGEPLGSANVPLELRSKLLERVKKDRLIIQQMSSQLSQLQDANKDLQRRAEEFQKMITQRAASGEMKTNLKWQEIRKKIQQERAKCVKDVRYVTSQLCPDSGIENILSEALKNMLSGSDPYINVEDSSAEDVEFLLRCNLVVRHPHHRRSIRLSDLI